MAVYTQVSAEEMQNFLGRFDLGTLRSFKGIAEGVENSNYLVETDRTRLILTLYEKRVEPADLPFFIALLDHLSARGCKVPRALPDRNGQQIHELCGRPACLIEFLEGVSVTHPTPQQARAAGAALANMHAALTDFSGTRANSMGMAAWRSLAEQCGDALGEIDPSLPKMVDEELAYLDANWPGDLSRSVIHADLFPDNVLMLGDAVTGLIDFYFSCSDIRALDIAITHGAWCFAADGSGFNRGTSDALLGGYTENFELSQAERAALPILARAGALRFTLTRAYDWINTPADALVTRKAPMAFARRLLFYRANENAALFA